MFKIKKRELSEDKKAELFKSGEKFAEKIKLEEKVVAINKFGNKKPFLMFSIIFFVIIGSLVLGFILPSNSDNNIKPVINNKEMTFEPSSAEEDLKNEIFSLYSEIETVTDTLLKIMHKDNLSADDSAFIIKQYTRLEEINYILNYELNSEIENE